MKRKIKKICAVFVIIVLLPYIITIFMNGKSIEANQDGKNGYIKVKTESGTKEVPLKEYCIGTLAKENPSKGDTNKKDPSQDKKPVKTGDATAAAGWMLAMTAAGAVVLVRKRNS